MVKALPTGLCSLQDDQVVNPGLYTPSAALIALDGRRTHPRGPDERMVVSLAVHLDAVPEMLREAYLYTGYGRAGFEKVVYEREAEVLDHTVQVILRQRVNGVSHGIRREQTRVVPPACGRLRSRP